MENWTAAKNIHTKWPARFQTLIFTRFEMNSSCNKFWSSVLQKHLNLSVPIHQGHLCFMGTRQRSVSQRNVAPRSPFISSEEEKQEQQQHHVQQAAALTRGDGGRAIPAHLLRVVWKQKHTTRCQESLDLRASLFVIIKPAACFYPFYCCDTIMRVVESSATNKLDTVFHDCCTYYLIFKIFLEILFFYFVYILLNLSWTLTTN